MSKVTSTGHTRSHAMTEAIKANDEKTLQSVYQANYKKTERFVLANNGSTAEAKDIYQEAFIAVWRNIQLDKFIPQNDTALEGYLFRVAKNKWLDHLRSAAYKKTIPMNERFEEAEETGELAEQDQQYLAAVKIQFQQLGTNCKEVLTRFYYKKQSLRKIAEALEWTEATARNNKYRCLEQLRNLMKNTK